MYHQSVMFLVVSCLLVLMHFTSISLGRSVEDELDMLVKRGREEDELDMLVKREEEIEDDQNVEAGYDYYGELQMENSFEKRPSSGPGLSVADKNKIVNMHNALRRGEGASDMQMIRYNNKLAELAQEWSARCYWGHRPRDSFSASNYGFSAVGENLYAGTGDGKNAPAKAIQAWFDEKNFYVYNTGQCLKEPCGHYTAVVWAGTHEIGCGMTKCPTLHNSNMRDAYYFVCNYGPAGNMVGEKPFKKGAACSECGSGQFYCTRDLCDRTCKAAGTGERCECKARCQNGTPTRNCKCQCNPGYNGVSCNERCEDKNRQCGANPGWPAKLCRDKSIMGGMLYDTVNQQCPKMCGKCN